MHKPYLKYGACRKKFPLKFILMAANFLKVAGGVVFMPVVSFQVNTNLLFAA